MLMTDATRNSMPDMIEMRGKNKIILIAVEEMSELIKALLKNINRGKDNREDILMELTDVSMFLEYVKMIYGFKDEEIRDYQDKVTHEKVMPKIEAWKKSQLQH